MVHFGFETFSSTEFVNVRTVSSVTATKTAGTFERVRGKYGYIWHADEHGDCSGDVDREFGHRSLGWVYSNHLGKDAYVNCGSEYWHGDDLNKPAVSL
jgi:hypothetical protein